MVNACEICNKEYSSYQSLWIHNKKFHNIKSHDNTNITQKRAQNSTEIAQNKIPIKNNKTCSYCNKIFTRIYSVKRHEETCKYKKIELDKITLLENQNKQLEEIINKLVLENNKIKNTTTNNTNNGTINTTNNTTNTTNNTTNNIQIVALGHEDISKLSRKKINMIMNSGYTAFYKLIEELNLNPKRPENNNVRVTNINSRYCDIFDNNTKKFIKKPKNEVLDDIIDSRTYNLDTLHTEYSEEGNRRHKCVRMFLDDLKKCVENKNTNIELKKEYKEICEKIILLIYNNQSFLET